MVVKLVAVSPDLRLPDYEADEKAHSRQFRNPAVPPDYHPGIPHRSVFLGRGTVTLVIS